METQVVVHRLDWFTRVILLFIMCILLGLLLKPIIQATPVLGIPEQRIRVDLNFDQFGGYDIGPLSIWNESIPVRIEE